MGIHSIIRGPLLPLAICLLVLLGACDAKHAYTDDAPQPPPVEVTQRVDAQPHEPSSAPAEEPAGGEGALALPVADSFASQATQAAAEEPIPPPEEIDQPPEEDFPYAPFPLAFTAQDIYGNTVTEADLGEKRLFFIHHWATWCGVCVDGLSDLADVAQEYGDQVGFIGLVDDYQTNISKAKRIAGDTGVPSWFIMVDAQGKELQAILNLVESGYFPTSVVIDGGAEAFEPKLIGTYGKGYAELLDILLE